MQKFTIALVVSLLLVFPAMAAKKKTQVIIPARVAVVSQPVPLIAIPPLAVALDLIRRTSCDPSIAVSFGKGDPGFDPEGPKTGNFLIPAIWQRCQSRPTPR